MNSSTTKTAAQVTPDAQNHVLSVRWQQCIKPPGFGIDERGVYFQPDGDNCAAIEVTHTPLSLDYLIRTPDGANWSAMLTWEMFDHRLVRMPFSLSVVQNKRAAFIQELTEGGLLVLDEEYFGQYLTGILRDSRLPRQWGVTQLGFATIGNDTQTDTPRLCFVLPNQTLYHDPDTVQVSVELLPSAHSPGHAAYYASGTLEEWKTMVEVTRENPLLTFMLSASLAATLLEASGVESGGFNLSGPTSRGKTTALQVAASVWGSGAATNQALRAKTLINTWHTTSNALESLAQAHSGLPLLIDEIGSHTSGALPIYALFAGQGKARMSGSGGMRDRATWQTFLFSTGEIDLDQHLQRQRTGKQSIDPGERNRFLNIPIDALSPPRSANEVEALKRDCGRLFGTAGPAFVQCILESFKGDANELRKELQAQVAELRDGFCAELEAEGRTLDTAHRRVIPRFALIAVAGHWAAAGNFEVLPHTSEEIMARVKAVMQAWLDGQPFETQDDQVIATFREYVQCHEGQMRSTENPDRIPSLSAGFIDRRHPQGPRLLLNDTQFKTACAGLNLKSAQVTLKRAGILHTNDDQFKTKVSIREFGIKNMRFYWLKLNVLLNDPTQADDLAEDLTNERASGPVRVVNRVSHDAEGNVRF